MRATIRSLKRPLLVLHSPIDQTVGIENAARIFEAAFHPKSFVSLDQADHLLSNPRDSRYVGRVIAGWAARFLELDVEEPALPPPPEGAVVVSTGAAGYTSGVQIGRHRLIADEPRSVGGADLGPAPYDFLLAGLGACTGMTLRMYADRKQWPLEGVDVQLRHAKIHAADCADCETKDGKIDRIERTITLSGPLDAEQRARLLEIADRCPVHRTLHSEIEIVTHLEG
jgi:putative redox protein